MNIEELFEQVDKIVEIIEENRKKTAPRMNLLDITGASHLEVKNSNILAFLLDPKAPHKRPDFGSLFLECLKVKVPNSIRGTTIRRVRREQVTDRGRFIDLFLETDQGEYIIIENKVEASDLDKQLEDYIKWVQETFKKDPVAVYLTPGGNLPGKHSLEKMIREDMEDKGHFLCLSYQDDIIKWLDQMLSSVTDGTDNELLRSAIVQYQDAVNGFCGQREEDVMEQAKIVNNLIRHYGLGVSFQETMKDLQEAAIGFQSAMDQMAIMQFLIVLQEMLRQDGKERVYLTLMQERKPNTEEWIKACIKNSRDIGIELALEESDQDFQYGIGLEFSEPTRKTSVYFGMMAHGRGSHSKSPRISIPKENLEDKGSISNSADDWWWQCTTVWPWFNQALFLYGADARWQEQGENLTSHVYNWFKIELVG